MEEFLDEWNGYAFTGQLLGPGRNGGGAIEYVVYVFTAKSYLFAQRLRATNEFLEQEGIDLKGGPYRIAGLLQSHALNKVKQRIKKRDFEPLKEYEFELAREAQS